MSTVLTQLGVKDEVTFGTPVTVDRFFEFNSFDVQANPGRVMSGGLQSGQYFDRADRNEPYSTGASGTVVFDVPTKGFGWWLKHMLGTTATGSVSDSNYTHTGTVGSLIGDFFTMQVAKPFNPAGTAQPFTYHGCKVTGWELSCDVDGVLVCTLDIDAEDEDTSTGLATASYPSDFRIFTWAGGAITIGGDSVEVKNFSVSGDNALDTDRRYIRGSSLKKEQIGNGKRTGEWSCTADFSSLTQYNRFVSSTRAGMYAAVVATFTGPIAHGGATFPQLVVTLPNARVDAADVSIDGPEALMQDISGVYHNLTANDAITITYRTTDATA